MEILDKKVFNVIFTFMEKLSTKPNVQYSYQNAQIFLVIKVGLKWPIKNKLIHRVIFKTIEVLSA